MQNKPNLITESVSSLREIFGIELTKLSKKNKKILVLDADVAGGTGLHHFRKAFPERFLQCGIAEQNMMGLSGGLSILGFKPIVTTFAIFCLRAFEQARLSIAYSNLDVKIIASHPGLDVGPDGASAQCLEDFACFRSLPNFVILSPCDPIELKLALRELIKHKGPVYMRTGRSDSKIIYKQKLGFKIGKGKVLLKGQDYYIISCGITTSRALEAAKKLQKKKISVGVINMSTIKPIDKDLILRISKKAKGLLTVEDHTIFGGLGSSVLEALSETKNKIPVKLLGLKTFGESGEPNELAIKYKIDENSICKKILELSKT